MDHIDRLPAWLIVTGIAEDTARALNMQQDAIIALFNEIFPETLFEQDGREMFRKWAAEAEQRAHGYVGLLKGGSRAPLPLNFPSYLAGTSNLSRSAAMRANAKEDNGAFDAAEGYGFRGRGVTYDDPNPGETSRGEVVPEDLSLPDSNSTDTNTGETSPDAALAANGGINFNAKYMNTDVSGDRLDVHLDPAMIAQFKSGNFTGVAATILNVTVLPSVIPLFNLTP
jgi:hypothetical protein